MLLDVQVGCTWTYVRCYRMQRSCRCRHIPCYSHLGWCCLLPGLCKQLLHQTAHRQNYIICETRRVHRQDGSWKLPEAAIPEQLISKAPKLSWIKPLQICSLLAVALRTKKVAGGRHPAKSKKCRGRFNQNHSESTNMSSLGRENAIHNRITVIYLTKPNKKHCKTHDFNVTLGCKSTWIGGRFSVVFTCFKKPRNQSGTRRKHLTSGLLIRKVQELQSPTRNCSRLQTVLHLSLP